MTTKSVIPAKVLLGGSVRRRTGIQPLNMKKYWTPAFAGVTARLVIFAGMMILFASMAIAAPHAFPVPFVEKEHGGRGIDFTDLPNNGTIRILTVAGEEVRKLDIPPGNIRNWDVKNSSGKTVATGIYFYLIDSGSEQTTGKLVVIR